MRIIKMKVTGLLFLLLITLFFSACRQTTPKPEPVKAPEQIISLETAREMYNTYSERRVPIIRAYEKEQNSNDEEFNPTRSGWYDFRTIKQYIAFIEQEAEAAGVEISGLQFYFANYPDRTKFEDGTPVTYPRKNSFFIVPTLKVEGKDYGFYTAESEDGERQAVLINERAKIVTDKLQKFDKHNESGSIANKTGQANSIFSYVGFSSGSGFSAANASPGQRSLILNESNLVPPPNQTDFD
ncbi:hypothetical protein GM418_12065 [Maribellus comscasis]|uniref:Uncharacterized protein n=1 Tax=Maribellus comscasis TaxID=2681766 RepID=A0A6I6K354_9BACT|nr:hypothetical protein [Maribellus comscasis]QGY44364.1 hypothetical protein GM418_12065 [Maribellus comscasis]